MGVPPEIVLEKNVGRKLDRQPVLTALLRALEGAFRPGDDRARRAALQRAVMETYARALELWDGEFTAATSAPSLFADFWGPKRIEFDKGSRVAAVIRHVARGSCKGLPPETRDFLFFMLGAYKNRPRPEPLQLPEMEGEVLNLRSYACFPPRSAEDVSDSRNGTGFKRHHVLRLIKR
jgi:hypothetical protein